MWSLIKVVLLSTLASATLRCPDGSSCLEDSACCKLPAGGYGCCPVEEDGFSRLSKAQVPEMKSGAESSRVSSNSSIVKCDQLYHCPNYYQCCKTDSGHWTCCPHPSTVCCYRGTKCCPADNTPSSAALEDRTDPVEGESLPEMAIQSNDISTGPAIGNQAKCCKDGGNCCPPGTECDPQSSKCRKDDVSFPWGIKKPALRISEAQENCEGSDCSVTRCDDTHICKAGTSCCKMSNHQWGCCPYPDAHCCWDGKHCCPHHHWCDTKTSRCRRWWPPYEWKQISSTRYDKGSENL